MAESSRTAGAARRRRQEHPPRVRPGLGREHGRDLGELDPAQLHSPYMPQNEQRL